jgi:nitroreductase
VWHYAPDRHALEQRCVFDAARWSDAVGERSQVLLALTSIHWREAWKYGERAFRYCQHDLGHAIAAIAVAASVHGMRARLLPAWSHDAIAALTGIDRDEDYVEAEREEPGCLIAIAGDSGERDVDREGGGGDEGAAMRELIEAVRRGRWTGRASQLSEDHVQWTFIDEIAAATRDSGRNAADYGEHAAPRPTGRIGDEASSAADYDRRLILQRRSALAFDGVSSVRGDTFLEMLRRAMPRAAAPWNALWWDPRIHLALFVHRVDGIDSGLYLLVRNRAALDLLRAAFRHEFLWTIADETLPLYLLARGDCRALARRLSCDQDIAADGFFSLGMIAHFDASLASEGVSFYRHLFWESGVVGQILYLEAERAGARATGIGCFYDDPVHDVLGLRGHAFQTLYHFTVGIPVEDPRLTSEPGYEWER